MTLILPTLLLLCGALIGNVFAADKIIVCYYGTWATYRTGLGKFDVANVNPYLCTHVIYTFVGINDEGTVISLDPYLDLEEGRDNFRQFNALKQLNPKLKTILAVGGWNEGSAKYSTMAASAESRQTFIKSALKMVLDYGFDGFDLDWEYPNKRDTTHGVADIDNFTQLTKELREEFDKHGLILSAAVSSTRANAGTSYDIPAISKYLDYIHVMTYDMHVGSESETGYNAAIYRSAQSTGASEDLNTIDASIQYWLQAGCPPEKILLGVPFYGHTFTLADASNSLVGAPSSGPGIAGPFTVTNGLIGYNEFCVVLQNETGWEVRRDELAMVPYAVQDVNWVSYDDPVSIAEKVKYTKQLGLAGVMIWSIETDDFHGLCGETYGLLKTINRAYGRGDITTEAPAAPTYGQTESEETVSSSASTTTAGSSEQVSSETVSILTTSQQLSTLNHVTDNIQMPTSVTELCKEEGIKSNPEDCASFIICVARIDGKFETYLLECPKNLLWDPLSNTCNYPENVQCNVQKT